MQTGVALSLRSLQLCIHPSKHCTQNQNWSEKRTLCHSFILSAIRQITVAISPYAALAREAECNGCKNSQVTMLQMFTSGNWAWCKHAHFLTNGPWCSYMILLSWPQNVSVLSGVSHERAMRSCMPFSMTVLKAIDSTFAWQWMDVKHLNKRYHETKIHTLDRKWSCFYRIPTFAGMLFFLLTEA